MSNATCGIFKSDKDAAFEAAANKNTRIQVI